MRYLMLGVLVMSSFSYAQEQNSKTTEIADNIYTFTTNGEYISMFVVTDAGVMVFETVNTSHAKSMLAEIRKITNKPIKYAFHSHNHWDHASGGQVFSMKARPPLPTLRLTNGWLPIRAGTWLSRRNRGRENKKISNWVEPRLNCTIWA
jgi:glyoxylase-like metal-dependent hydrolase (beta-lactamase superfamily II)